MTDLMQSSELAHQLARSVAVLKGAAVDVDLNAPASTPATLSDLANEVETQALSTLRQLASARSQVKSLIEALRVLVEAILVADADGNILYAVGFDSRVGADGTDEDPVSVALHEVLSAAISGRQQARTLELLGPPQRSLVLTGIPMCIDDGPDNGEPCGAVAIAEDATEYRRLDAAHRDFVANMSHELKTPIGALGLLAETLMIEKDPEVSARLMQRMHVETMRAAQVIDDLLNLSRVESVTRNDIQLQTAGSLIEAAISRVRYAAEHHSIAIITRGDVNAPVCGGPRELVSAIHHLIENAISYSDDNSSVEITVESKGEWTEISVIDHGPGIASENIDRIFQRYYRVDGSQMRTAGGTGLGLSIVRRVVHNHGGEVRVVSEEGSGSTFTLKLAATLSLATGQSVVEGGADG